MEYAPPGVVRDGVGGARKRIKKANFSIAFNPAGVPVASVLVTSFGVVANWHAGFSSRSVGNISLLIPISVAYARAALSNRDLFWAFQPNREIVPSTLLWLARPPMPWCFLIVELAA